MVRESAFLVVSYMKAPGHWTWDPERTIFDASQPRTVLELGAGVGTAGLSTAGLLPPVIRSPPSPSQPSKCHHVVLTDLPDVCALLRRNASSFHREGVCVHVRALPWGDRLSSHLVVQEFRPTHILCSDLVYFPELLAPLLSTLLDITDQVPDAPVLIAYKIRSLTKEQPFWTALGVWFDFTWVQCAAPGASMQRFGSHASHFVHPPPCNHDGVPQDDFFLFVAHRLPHTLAWTRPQNAAHLLSGMHVDHGRLVTAEGTDKFEWMMLSAASDSYLH